MDNAMTVEFEKGWFLRQLESVKENSSRWSNNNMTDYLAEIAAWTVECSNLDCKGTGYITKYGGLDGTVPTETLCAVCMNTGRVLDPRFAELRIGCVCNKGYWNPGASRPKVPCKHCQAKGYTINRDLGVLLECMKPVSITFLCSKPKLKWGVHVIGDYHSGISDDCDTGLEAAAKAVYEWLGAEKKEKR